MLRQLVSRGLRARSQLEKFVCVGSQAWTRGLADSPAIEDTAEDDSVKYSPPVPVHGIAGRYAAALYMAGAKANLLQEIEADLSEISDTTLESEELRTFLKDPSIPKSAKQEALDEIAKKLECQDLTKNFLALLNENGRLGEFMKISTTYEELVAAARGEVVATVTTAEELEDAELEEIKESLKALLEKDQTLLMQTEVDPAIIGGIVIDIGDKHMDLSISSRIKRLQQLVLDSA